MFQRITPRLSVSAKVERLEARQLFCFEPHGVSGDPVRWVESGGLAPLEWQAGLTATPARDGGFVGPQLAEAASPTVTALVLMNADTGEPIGRMTPGMTIDYGVLPTRRLSVRADVAGSVGSVRFGLDGNATFQTENFAPFAIRGDTNGQYHPWTPATGPHTLTARASSATGGGGEAGTPYSVDFTVLDGDAGASGGAGAGGGGADGSAAVSSVAVPSGAFAWTSAAISPIARVEAQGIAVDGKLYVFGGYYNSQIQATRRSDVYDPATNAWKQLANLPEAVTHAGVAADGRNIYLAGGFVGNHPGPDTNKVWRYNIDSNSFHPVISLPAGRGGGALVRVGRNLHFFAGADWPSGSGSIKQDFGTHWALNLDKPTAWVAKATMPNPRNHVSGVALDGKVYAIGGQHLSNETSGNQSAVHRYDPATNAWTAVANLPKPLGHTTASTFVRNGRINVLAGLTQDSKATASAYEYDPRSNTWAALPDAPGALQSPVAAYIDGRLIFTGGATDAGGPTRSTFVGVLDNRWNKGTAAPASLGEVAAGIVNNKLYVVGEGSSQTFAYNIATGSWTSGLKARPHLGDHHTAEVVNGKLYLFGGFNGGSAGKVQIYNPATNSWSLGASVPFAAGSMSSALIGGKVYVAGGIVNFLPNVGGQTTTKAAVYNPATNTWTSIAAMPRGAHHTAAGTDGRKFYVFGGRDGKGDVTNGFATVQAYDPATNTWRSSDQAGSGLAPLPLARGGMGKAAFANGEFYLMGGETRDGGGATAERVYSRVDVYKPLTNTWRLASPMPTARHGVSPLLHAGRIYVAMGGTRAGFSQSRVMEILNLT